MRSNLSLEGSQPADMVLSSTIYQLGRRKWRWLGRRESDWRPRRRSSVVDGDLGCDGEVFFRRTLSQLNCNLGPCLLKCCALTWDWKEAYVLEAPTDRPSLVSRAVTPIVQGVTPGINHHIHTCPNMKCKRTGRKWIVFMKVRDEGQCR